jgi:NADH dehydrogenase
MRLPSVAGDQWPGLERLGIRPSAMEAVVPLYLGADQGPARLDQQRARARRG